MAHIIGKDERGILVLLASAVIYATNRNEINDPNVAVEEAEKLVEVVEKKYFNAAD